MNIELLNREQVSPSSTACNNHSQDQIHKTSALSKLDKHDFDGAIETAKKIKDYPIKLQTFESMQDKVNHLLKKKFRATEPTEYADEKLSQTMKQIESVLNNYFQLACMISATYMGLALGSKFRFSPFSSGVIAFASSMIGRWAGQHLTREPATFGFEPHLAVAGVAFAERLLNRSISPIA